MSDETRPGGEGEPTPAGLLQAAVRAFQAADAELEALPGSAVAARVAELFASAAAAITAAEAARWPPAEIRAALAPARAVYAQAPFARHTQTWPRGYPGDFEIVEDMVAQHNRAEPGTLAWHLEAYTLTLPICQQHRNKIAHQVRLITETLATRPPGCRPPGPARRILLIAAGGATDLRRVPPAAMGPADVFVLNDIDPDALEFARHRLDRVAEQCVFVPGNVARRLDELAEHGPYDLVLAGGLFDYLSDPAARRLSERVVRRLTAPGGRFYFSNIATPHPYRWLGSYLLDWPLIDRDEAGVTALLAPLRDEVADLRIHREQTGLAVLAEVHRAVRSTMDTAGLRAGFGASAVTGATSPS